MVRYEPTIASPQSLMLRLKELGHYDNPDHPTGVTFDDLPKQKLHSPQTKTAIRSFMEVMSWEAERNSFAEHDRAYHYDGEFGPATEKTILAERCGHPDYHVPELSLYDGYDQLDPWEQPAVGRGGNWPRCHNIGDFHCANVNILNNPPSHLSRNGNFEAVLRAVTKAYAEFGLQLYWGGKGSPIQDEKSGYQLTMEFVGSSNGWIGLAQVVSNRPCNSTHWSRYLASYLRSSTDANIRRMWAILLMHELGHNCGTSHTRGGVMNPGILSLAATWRGDPLEPWLRSRYGGQPIPQQPGPDPDPDPDGPEDLGYWLRGVVTLMKGDKEISPFQLQHAPTA